MLSVSFPIFTYTFFILASACIASVSIVTHTHTRALIEKNMERYKLTLRRNRNPCGRLCAKDLKCFSLLLSLANDTRMTTCA